MEVAQYRQRDQTVDISGLASPVSLVANLGFSNVPGSVSKNLFVNIQCVRRPQILVGRAILHVMGLKAWN
jgi:hypothetical protein